VHSESDDVVSRSVGGSCAHAPCSFLMLMRLLLLCIVCFSVCVHRSTLLIVVPLCSRRCCLLRFLHPGGRGAQPQPDALAVARADAGSWRCSGSSCSSAH
jgi:hypothetical protein